MVNSYRVTPTNRHHLYECMPNIHSHPSNPTIPPSDVLQLQIQPLPIPSHSPATCKVLQRYAIHEREQPRIYLIKTLPTKSSTHNYSPLSWTEETPKKLASCRPCVKSYVALLCFSGNVRNPIIPTMQGSLQ